MVGIRVWYGRSLRQEGNSAKQYTTLKDDQISGGRDDIVSDVGGSKDHSAGEISDMGGGVRKIMRCLFLLFSIFSALRFNTSCTTSL